MPEPPGHDSPTALVAHGSRFNTRTIRDALARLGVRTVTDARDGAEAVMALSECRPDLLVLDWDLAVIGARDILAAARDAARSHAPAMPVMVTMAQPTRSAVDAAMALRADAILAEPFSPRELRLRLTRLVTGVGNHGAAPDGLGREVNDRLARTPSAG